MKIVVSSKLFASKSIESQNKIKAAMDDPRNKELIQQLDEYVDDKYLEPQRKQKTEEAKVIHDEAPQSENEGGDNISIDRSVHNTHMSAPSGGPSNIPDDFAAIGEMDESSEGGSEDGSEEGAVIPEEVAGDVESSTQIKANTDVNVLIPDEIKGSLNLSESTAGVSRVVITDAEVWVYYQDKINLNNIMNNVIEFASSKYFQLAFNRLARSDNAIVFDIVDQSSKVVESVPENDEK